MVEGRDYGRCLDDFFQTPPACCMQKRSSQERCSWAPCDLQLSAFTRRMITDSFPGPAHSGYVAKAFAFLPHDGLKQFIQAGYETDTESLKAQDAYSVSINTV